MTSQTPLRARRNVSEIDRIMLQAKREEIVARKAKAKQVSTLKQGASVPAKLPKRESVNTRRECAAAAGVGERTYDAGKLPAVLTLADETNSLAGTRDTAAGTLDDSGPQ